MSHVKDRHELWALSLLNQIIERDKRDRDALPGSVVKLVKDAARIIRKRQDYKRRKKRKGLPPDD